MNLIYSRTRMRKQFDQFLFGFQGWLLIYGNNQEMQKVVGIFPIRGTFSFQYGNFTVYIWTISIGPCSRHKGIDGVFFNLSN